RQETLGAVAAARMARPRMAPAGAGHPALRVVRITGMGRSCTRRDDLSELRGRQPRQFVLRMAVAQSRALGTGLPRLNARSSFELDGAGAHRVSPQRLRA